MKHILYPHVLGRGGVQYPDLIIWLKNDKEWLLFEIGKIPNGKWGEGRWCWIDFDGSYAMVNPKETNDEKHIVAILKELKTNIFDETVLIVKDLCGYRSIRQ